MTRKENRGIKGIASLCIGYLCKVTTKSHCCQALQGFEGLEGTLFLLLALQLFDLAFQSVDLHGNPLALAADLAVRV